MLALIQENPFLSVVFALILVKIVCTAIFKNSSRTKDLDVREKNLNSRASELSVREKKFEAQLQESEALKKQNVALLQENSRLRLGAKIKPTEEELREYVDSELAKSTEKILHRPYFSGAAVFQDLANTTLPLEKNERLFRALRERARIEYPLQVTSTIVGSTGERYTVTLDSCTCKDFELHHRPCKHMYRLALEMGVFLNISKDRTDATISRLESRKADFDRSYQQAANERTEADKRLRAATEKEKAIVTLCSGKEQTFPWLAHLLADFDFLQDRRAEAMLRSVPESKAAEQRRRLQVEKRMLAAQNKMLEYQLHTYESLFPWLEEFKELTPAEASAVATASAEDEEYQRLRYWLSADEYSRLSDAEKHQLALDRWKVRKRSNWEAGIDYERYIGYEYERKGYRVSYCGATQGKQDMGRDLIATRGRQTFVIQCKRYAKGKPVRENSIFQLYGSYTLYRIDASPDLSVSAVLYTTSELSDVARSCADLLSIVIREDCPLPEYPLIKCNISKDGSRIYHMPYDQQYDRIRIEVNRGEFYAATVAEAEEKGFRHAYRWAGSK